MKNKSERNKPCYCGSGKKTKFCHGAGPKRKARVQTHVARREKEGG